MPNFGNGGFRWEDVWKMDEKCYVMTKVHRSGKIKMLWINWSMNGNMLLFHMFKWYSKKQGRAVLSGLIPDPLNKWILLTTRIKSVHSFLSKVSKGLAFNKHGWTQHSNTYIYIYLYIHCIYTSLFMADVSSKIFSPVSTEYMHLQTFQHEYFLLCFTFVFVLL